MGLYKDIKGLLKKSGDIRTILMAMSGEFKAADYDRMVRDAYQFNPIARACCDLILDNAGDVEWILRTGGLKPKEVTSHPVLDHLANPMPGLSKSRFIKHLVGSLIIYNKAYVYMNNIKSSMGELEPLYPGGITPKYAKNQAGRKIITKYEYRVDEGVRYFQPDELIVFELFSPSPVVERVMSPLQAAMHYVDIMNQAALHNYRLVKNGGRPSSVLTTEGTVSENQQKQITEAIDRMVAPERDGRPAVLQGGLKPVNLGFSPQEMGWNNLDLNAAQKICAALGVPAQCVGIPGSQTYANMEQAYKALWEGTILKKYMYCVRDSLNAGLVSQYDRNLELDVNTDKIEALHDSVDAIYTRANNASFLSINQKLEMTKWPTLGPKGDVILVPSGSIPRDLLLAGTGDTETPPIGDSGKELSIPFDEGY